MKSLRSIIGAVMLAAGTCFAAEPTHDLTPQTAVKLIKLLLDDRQDNIEVAMILEGAGKDGKFEEKHVRRVVAVHPVAEEGKRVRRMTCYDFHWSETFGWFYWEKRQIRGGDAILIWSELKGEQVVK